GYENSFLNPAEAAEHVTPQTLLIVVDTHLEHVLESSEIYRICKNVVVIDHHRRMVGYIDNAVIFYHEPYASSASEMVTELIQYFGEKNRISRIESEALLAGIMLDTKNFTIRTGVRTFEAAAYLRRQGADTVEVRKLFSSTMESYQRRARVVSSAEVYHRCAIACSNSMTDDIKLVAPQAADELLNISDVDASFVLYEYDGGVSISARSMGKINVQVIMERLGGGGHQTMSATQMPEISMEDARLKLLEAIEEYMVNNEKSAQK
ncbi:MAG: DHH family phosphoesterase, partial [Oscillospiraceae bacterium]